MTPRFQFFAVSTRYSLENGLVTLHELLTTVRLGIDDFPLGLVVHSTVGAVLTEDMQGQSLVLVLTRLEAGLTGTRIWTEKLNLPKLAGPRVMPFECRIPIPSPGSYALSLFDAGGAFGPPQTALAAYCFDVIVRDGPRMPRGSGLN